MQRPTYLKLSRHHVFYFVWPLPAHLRQPGKSKHVKVSLRTSDRKEALQLSRMLDYHASVLIEHEGKPDKTANLPLPGNEEPRTMTMVEQSDHGNIPKIQTA